MLWTHRPRSPQTRSRPARRTPRPAARPLSLEPLEARALLSFLPPVVYDAGHMPWSVAVADLNGDGASDLVTADLRTHVSVLLGRGDGTFQDPVRYDAGPRPFNVAAADFNGDGLADLAVTNNTSAGTVSILLNDGDGSFRPPVVYRVGPRPEPVAVGDFTGDGVLDIVAANSGPSLRETGSVSVLAGNGDGTFQDALDTSVDLSPKSLAVADFDGDGTLDLVMTGRNSPGGSSRAADVLLGRGDGSFQAGPSYDDTDGNHWALVAADFNDDRRPDFAVAIFTILCEEIGGGNIVCRTERSYVSVFLGKGDGSFQGPTDFDVAATPFALAAADFNSDGFLDLVTANRAFLSPGHTLSVLLGTGDGSFQKARDFPTGVNPYAAAVGDFNADGSPDVAVPDPLSASVSVLLNAADWGGAAPGGGASTGLLGQPATPAPVVAAPAVSAASSQGAAADWFFATPREEDRVGASARNRRLVADLDLSLDQEFQRVSNSMF